jgi:hypothetical protein
MPSSRSLKTYDSPGREPAIGSIVENGFNKRHKQTVGSIYTGDVVSRSAGWSHVQGLGPVNVAMHAANCIMWPQVTVRRRLKKESRTMGAVVAWKYSF